MPGPVSTGEIYPSQVRVIFAAQPHPEMVKQKLLAAGLVLAAIANGQTAPLSQSVTLDQAIREALAKNLDLAAEKRNISVAEALTVSGQTLNILGANDSPSTPLGPNQLNTHADFQSIRFLAPPLAVHNTI